MLVTTVSDVHNTHPDLPEADLLICAGDLTIHGFRIELYRALLWLEGQRRKFDHSVIIFGNHDLYAEEHPEDVHKSCTEIGYHHLHNTHVIVDGLKIWGSPHTPNYHGWAFMLDDEALKTVWSGIPDDSDILVTHSPPRDILDNNYRGDIGCRHLLRRVLEVRPKLHVFGHAHDGKGVMNYAGVKFVNAATTVIQVEI